MNAYPHVADEFETVCRILKGRSLARFGDGELKVMSRHIYVREPTPVPKLARELQRMASRPHKQCLIGIPTMDPDGNRYENWKLFRPALLKYFHPRTRIQYVSAFVSRPDCHTARLDTDEYYQHVIQIWQHKSRIAVVSEVDSKLLEYLRLTHWGEVWHVACPTYGAYAEIKRLERQVIDSAPDIALLSCGPTATALAHRLTVRGLQAVDLGSIGGFLLRRRARGRQPMSQQEYKAERERAYGPDDHRAHAEELQ